MKKVYAGVITGLLLASQSAVFASNGLNDCPAPVVNAIEIRQDNSIIKEIIESIPSPVELSMVIKDQEGLYSKTYLNPTANESKYNTSFKQALNLGIYGTDLGFANIYGRYQDITSYLNVVQGLAEDLSIGQFFEIEQLRKLAESQNNINQLIAETTSNFDKINFHLREQNRDNLSILMLTGGWVESLYLTTRVYEKSKNEVIREKIGEQQVVLGQIMLVLDMYKSNPEFADLVNDLHKLEDVYSQIEMETTYGEATQELVDGQLVAVGGSSSTVNITDADVQSISSIVRSIRNKMIN
jgi:hypothetical protein